MNGTVCTPWSVRVNAASTVPTDTRPWSPATPVRVSPLPSAVGAASSSTTTWARSWHSTPPHGGLVAASARELAAVPVATGYTATSCSKISPSTSVRRAEVASSP